MQGCCRINCTHWSLRGKSPERSVRHNYHGRTEGNGGIECQEGMWGWGSGKQNLRDCDANSTLCWQPDGRGNVFHTAADERRCKWKTFAISKWIQPSVMLSFSLSLPVLVSVLVFSCSCCCFRRSPVAVQSLHKVHKTEAGGTEFLSMHREKSDLFICIHFTFIC